MEQKVDESGTSDSGVNLRHAENLESKTTPYFALVRGVNARVAVIKGHGVRHAVESDSRISVCKPNVSVVAPIVVALTSVTPITRVQLNEVEGY